MPSATTSDSGKVTVAIPIDPTANVLALVSAESRRQDDLRIAEANRIDEKLKAFEDCLKDNQAIQLKAQNDLAAAESKRIDALAKAESTRLDSVLDRQRADVALASEKTAATAATLATQVTTSAEALRAQVAMTAEASRQQVATSASASAAEMNQMRDTFDKRLTLLERALYQTGGRDEQRAEGRQGTQWLVPVIVSIAAIIVALLVALALKNGHVP